MEPRIEELGGGARLLGALAVVSDPRGDEGQIADLLPGAPGTRRRHRPAVRGGQDLGEAAGGVAAGAGLVGEQHLLAPGTGDLEDAVDELLAVVDPGDRADRLAPHEGHAAVDVGAEREPSRWAGGAPACDQLVEARLRQRAHALTGPRRRWPPAPRPRATCTMARRGCPPGRARTGCRGACPRSRPPAG